MLLAKRRKCKKIHFFEYAAVLLQQEAFTKVKL